MELKHRVRSPSPLLHEKHVKWKSISSFLSIKLSFNDFTNIGNSQEGAYLGYEEHVSSVRRRGCSEAEGA